MTTHWIVEDMLGRAEIVSELKHEPTVLGHRRVVSFHHSKEEAEIQLAELVVLGELFEMKAGLFFETGPADGVVRMNLNVSLS